MKRDSAAILCGGLSSRMGFDKSLLIVQGKMMLEVLANELDRVFSEVILVTNEKDKFAGSPALSRYRMVEDIFPGCGPVGGIYTALEAANHDRVFVMGCDMPVIDFAFIAKMRALLADDCDAAVPHHDSFIEPLYAFYAKRICGILAQSIRNDKLAVRQSYNQMKVRYCDTVEMGANRHIFANLNYPEDLNGVEQYFETMRGKEDQCTG